MKIRYDVISDVGRTRQNNEDMALVFGAFIRDDAQQSMVPMASRPRFTALVADGMGGYGGGEIASEMTLRSFADFLRALPADMDAREVSQAVKEWFRLNNDTIRARAASDPELANMGCTLTGIFTYGDTEFMLNAGDSRVYRLRYDTLRQLSTDHSERNRTGDPTVPSNLIYNAAGVEGGFVDVTNLTEEMPVIDGDVYVICSDGLCDMISDERIEEILRQGGGARELTDAALDAGGLDNCTVIVLRIAGEPLEQPESVPAESTDVSEPGNAEAAAEETPSETLKALPPAAPIAGFSIDDEESSEPSEPSESSENSEPSADAEEEITEEEASRLVPGEPTAAERRKMAAGRLRDALGSLLGRKK